MATYILKRKTFAFGFGLLKSAVTGVTAAGKELSTTGRVVRGIAGAAPTALTVGGTAAASDAYKYATGQAGNNEF